MFSRRPFLTLTAVALVLAGILALTDYHRVHSVVPGTGTSARTASALSTAPSQSQSRSGVWTTTMVERAFSGVAPPPPLISGIQTAQFADFDRLTFGFTGPKPPGYRAEYLPQAINEDTGQPVILNGPVILQLTFSPASNLNPAGQVTMATPPGLVMPNFTGLKSYLLNGNFENHMSFALGLSSQNGFHVSEVQPSPGHWTIVVDVRH